MDALSSPPPSRREAVESNDALSSSSSSSSAAAAAGRLVAGDREPATAASSAAAVVQQRKKRRRDPDPDIEAELEETRRSEEERASVTDQKQMREDITKRIEELILQLNPSLDRRKAAVVARHLDSKLFAASATFERYADPHSLDERLRSLARGIGLQIRRAQQSKQQQQQQQNKVGDQDAKSVGNGNGGGNGGGNGAAYSEERKELLRKRVGDELYADINRLVAEVEEIRRTNGAWTWIQKAAASAAAAQAASSSSFRKQQQQRASLSMPPGLTSIYFGTPLVEAHRALTARGVPSLQAEERVYRVGWEELAAEARGNVEAFREMEDEARSMQTCGLKRSACAFAW